MGSEGITNNMIKLLFNNGWYLCLISLLVNIYSQSFINYSKTIGKKHEHNVYKMRKMQDPHKGIKRFGITAPNIKLRFTSALIMKYLNFIYVYKYIIIFVTLLRYSNYSCSQRSQPPNLPRQVKPPYPLT